MNALATVLVTAGALILLYLALALKIVQQYERGMPRLT